MRKAGSQKWRAGSLMILGADTTVKSCGGRRDPVEEGAPRRFGLMLVEALEHHEDRKNAARGEAKLLAPMRIEERLGVEFEDL